MALRDLRFEGDEILRKKSRVVEKINDSVKELLDDLAQTMYSCGNGVGLAAPQVGVLKRVAVVDVGDGIVELINPEIIETKGEHIVQEGCLSVPGVYGEVKRPVFVKVKTFDREGNEQIIQADEFFAQALCHEIDHLDGILFTDKVIRYLSKEQ